MAVGASDAAAAEASTPARRRRSAAASAAATGASAPSAGLGAPRKVPTEAIDYAIPALEIVGFDFLVNRVNYHFGSPKDDYAVTAASIRRNLHSGWSSDRDPFNINQLGHPVPGLDVPRLRPLGRLQLLGVGRLHVRRQRRVGDRRRDDAAVASTTRSRAASAAPSSARRCFACRTWSSSTAAACRAFWRELAAAAISPATGFNRLVFGDRYGAVFSSKDAAYLQPAAASATRAASAKNVGVTSTTKFQAQRGAGRLLDRLRPARA